MCKCFNALITPILEYGSQIWDFQLGRLSEIEIIHRKFCKFTLNVYTFLSYIYSILTKFRLSCHFLAIETGRYTRPPLPPEERVCQVCNVTEDEKHFLLQCPTTCSLPEFQSLMALANNYIPNFVYLPLDTQFSTLMSSHHQQIIHNIARLLYVAFNHRQYLYFFCIVTFWPLQSIKKFLACDSVVTSACRTWLPGWPLIFATILTWGRSFSLTCDSLALE